MAQYLIENYVREFLGKTLEGKRAPLLDGGKTAAPEATVPQYGR